MNNRGEYISHFLLGMDYDLVCGHEKDIEHFKKAIEIKDPGTPALLARSLHSVVLLLPNDPELTEMQAKVKGLIEYDWPVDVE